MEEPACFGQLGRTRGVGQCEHDRDEAFGIVDLLARPREEVHGFGVVEVSVQLGDLEELLVGHEVVRQFGLAPCEESIGDLGRAVVEGLASCGQQDVGVERAPGRRRLQQVRRER